MTHPTPPLSGDNAPLDDEDVILLTDEIPPSENADVIEIRQLDDRMEHRKASKMPEPSKDFLNFDMEEISPSMPANGFSDSRGLPAGAAAEDQVDDLQRLIDEVVHDSQGPPQDFSGIPAGISRHVVSSAEKGELLSLPQDRIDAAMERVIRNLFAEKIEPILDEVITATVNREIENLKTVLLDYLSSGKITHKVKF